MPLYTYELRQGSATVATGRIATEREFQPGDTWDEDGRLGIVEEVRLMRDETRLIVKLDRKPLR